MRPIHRDFRDFKMVFLGEKNQFDIKTPIVHHLLCEYLFRGLLSIEFETAVVVMLGDF